MVTRLALAAVLWIGLLEATRAVNTYYVATNGTGNGTTWALATSNIQAAVTSAVDDDIVLVSNGTYYCWSNSATAGYTSMVTVAKRVTIQSVSGPGVTIVDGNFPAITNRCFYITATATVAGFTITNGHTVGDNRGGGVFIQTSGKVTNCWITGNAVTNGLTTGYGGGVYLTGSVEVVNCRIYANITANTNGGGAGVYAINGGLIRDCVISNNIYTNISYAADASLYATAVLLNGGCLLTNCVVISNQCKGVIMLGLTATVDTCRVVGNISPYYTGGAGNQRGGGFWLYSQNSQGGIIRNCQIINNISGSEGGGAYIEGGIVSNCVISNNYSAGSGGGLYIMGGQSLAGVVVQVRDCTIINNRTVGGDGGPGGGVYIDKNCILRNCLIANNYAGYGGVCLTLRTSGAADTTTRVENCTIVSNYSSRSYGFGGGGIYCSAGSTSLVINTIIYSNLAAFSDNNWRTNSPGMTFTNCCTTPTTNLPGSGNISNAPVFVDFAAGNYRLAQGSPCINAGINLDWMINAVDLDGHRRMDGFSGRPDIGCYEFVPAGTMFRVR